MAAAAVANPASSQQYTEYIGNSDRYAAVDRVLDNRGPWTDEQFVGGSTVRHAVREVDYI